MEKLRQKLKIVPHNPGIYIMRNAENTVIYVGKAKDLKKRVSSYFRATTLMKKDKVAAMVSHIDDFEWIITQSEVEALLLEENYIKQFRPKYNIDLKDGKRYPFVCVTINEDFPRVFITRNKYIKKAKYFGPYINSTEIRDILDHLQESFKYKICKENFDVKIPKRECLNYHIKKCYAPCVGKISKVDYAKSINEVVEVLRGNYNKLIDELTQSMVNYSNNLEFEKAGMYRDRIEAVKRLLTTQRIHDVSSNLTADFIGYFSKEEIHTFVIIRLIDGMVTGRIHKSYTEKIEEDTDELFTSFFHDFYKKDPDPPKKIFIDKTIEYDEELLQLLFNKITDKKCEFINQPQKANATLLKMAQENATLIVNNMLMENINSSKINEENAVYELQEKLKLNKLPKSIECFDIAHLQGEYTVASCVRFTDGKPDKKNYKKFKIKTVEGISDYHSMQEVLTRRVEHFADWGKPDLMVIDGGIPQLNGVTEIFEKNRIFGIDLISLAKREEEVFLPHIKESVLLEKNSQSLRLLQRARDEAHRFCNSFHKELRSKGKISSELTKIDGVGEKSLKILLDNFESVKKIKELSVEEIASVKGISKTVSENIFNYFNEKKEKNERF